MAEENRGLLGSVDDAGSDCDISGKDHPEEHVYGVTIEKKILAGALPALERRVSFTGMSDTWAGY